MLYCIFIGLFTVSFLFSTGCEKPPAPEPVVCRKVRLEISVTEAIYPEIIKRARFSAGKEVGEMVDWYRIRRVVQWEDGLIGVEFERSRPVTVEIPAQTFCVFLNPDLTFNKLLTLT